MVCAQWIEYDVVYDMDYTAILELPRKMIRGSHR